MRIEDLQTKYKLPFLAIVELAIRQQQHNVKNAEKYYNKVVNESSLIWLDTENNVLRKLCELRAGVLNGRRRNEQVEDS